MNREKNDSRKFNPRTRHRLHHDFYLPRRIHRANFRARDNRAIRNKRILKNQRKIRRIQKIRVVPNYEFYNYGEKKISCAPCDAQPSTPRPE